MERASELLSNPDFKKIAKDKLKVNANDPIFLAIKLDYRDKRTTSLNWLFAEHLLISEAFHAEIDCALSNLVIEGECVVMHGSLKSGARAKEMTAVGGDFGNRKPKPCTRFLKDLVRCSVVCTSHSAMGRAYDLVLRSFAAAGLPKDRRFSMPYDVLLNVFFKDLVVRHAASF